MAIKQLFIGNIWALIGYMTDFDRYLLFFEIAEQGQKNSINGNFCAICSSSESNNEYPARLKNSFGNTGFL